MSEHKKKDGLNIEEAVEKTKINEKIVNAFFKPSKRLLKGLTTLLTPFKGSKHAKNISKG